MIQVRKIAEIKNYTFTRGPLRCSSCEKQAYSDPGMKLITLGKDTAPMCLCERCSKSLEFALSVVM